MSKLPVADSYAQAWYDYGAFRNPVLGFGIHMAEGGGTVGYLDRNGDPPPRGVSVHFVIPYDGSIVQMLDVAHACGGLNPDDRSTNKAYYGHDILVAVLGTFWTNPNAASIQIEIEGFAKDGPNAKQVAAVIRLVPELRKVHSTLRGAFGHADQTDTKGCPGTTTAMRDLFAAIGGHGRWNADSMALAVNGGDRVLSSDYFREVVRDTYAYRSTNGDKLRAVAKGTIVDDMGVPIDTPWGWAYVRLNSPAYDGDAESEHGIALMHQNDLGTRTRKGDAMLLETAKRYHDLPVVTAPSDPAALTGAFNDGVTAAATAAATAHK